MRAEEGGRVGWLARSDGREIYWLHLALYGGLRGGRRVGRISAVNRCFEEPEQSGRMKRERRMNSGTNFFEGTLQDDTHDLTSLR